LLFEKFKFGFGFKLKALLLLSQFDLVVIFFLLNDLSQLRALILPVMQFCLKLHSFLVGLVQYVTVLLQLVDLHLILLQLLLALLLLVLDLIFELIDDIVVVFLVGFLELSNLVLQGDGALQLLIVFPLQLFFNLGTIDLSAIELLMQIAQ
jgi:hypothetical protein